MINSKVWYKTEHNFPKLMCQYNNNGEVIIVVLMTGRTQDNVYGIGTVVYTTNEYSIGTYRTYWPIERFSDFSGEISLKNS